SVALTVPRRCYPECGEDVRRLPGRFAGVVCTPFWSAHHDNVVSGHAGARVFGRVLAVNGAQRAPTRAKGGLYAGGLSDRSCWGGSLCDVVPSTRLITQRSLVQI